MPEQITFTTAAFGGFEKKQVLDYIFKIHEEADQAQASHKKKLEEISVAFKDLENRAIAAEKNNIKYEQDIRQSKDQMKNSIQENILVEEELAKYKEKTAQYELMLSQRKSQPQPSNAFELESQNLIRQKQEIQTEYIRMEESSAKIGRVMLDAHNKAELIVVSSQKEANRIMAQAKEAIEKQRVQMNATIRNHQEQINRETQDKIRSSQQEAAEITLEAEEYAKNLRKEIQELANRATHQLEELRTQLIGLGGTTKELRQEVDSFTTTKLSHDTTEEVDSSELELSPTSTQSGTENIFDFPDFSDFQMSDFTLDSPDFSPDIESYEPSLAIEKVDYSSLIFDEIASNRETFSPMIMDNLEEKSSENIPAKDPYIATESYRVQDDSHFSNPFETEKSFSHPQPEGEIVSSISDELGAKKDFSLSPSEIPQLNFNPENIKKERKIDLDENTFPSLEPPE